MKTASKRTIDIVEFEKWIQSIPDSIDVRSWNHQGLALWPLFKTTLVGLGILARIEQPRHGMPTGRLGWRAGVMADYFALSGLCKTRPLRLPALAPAEGLSGAIVYYASGGHGRNLGELFVTPSLDVPAALLGRARRRSVSWYEDLEAASESLVRNARRARGHARFSGCCAVAAGHLRLKQRFLQLWFARQVNLALAVAQAFEQVFARDGVPIC